MRIKRTLIAGALVLGLAPLTSLHATPPITPTIVFVDTGSAKATWGDPGAALGFIVDASSFSGFSGALVSSTTYDTTLSTLTVLGLLPNSTFYFRVGSLVVGTTDYATTSPASVMTLAATPGKPTFNSIGTNSANVTWSANTNPGTTPYEVSKSTVSDFSANISTPITFGANYVSNTTALTGLSAGTTYYVRVRARNQSFINTVFSSTNSFVTTTSGGGATGSGTGTASITPASISGGDVVSGTVTFVVPASGMAAGGRIEIGLPSGWGPIPQTNNSTGNGYVYAVGGGSFTVTPSTSQSVYVTLNSTPVSAGTQIRLIYQNLFTNCYPASQTQVSWVLKSAMSTTDSLSSIASPPTQNIATGAARWLSYVPWSILTVAANQPSLGLTVQVNDMCGQPVVTASSITVNLSAYLPSGSTPDTSAAFSTASNFATTTSFIGVPAGSSTTVFYYRTSTSGTGLSIRGDYFSPFDGSNQQIWRSVNVLANSFSFANPSVDNGTPVSGQTSMSLSPNGDGVNDQAYIRFTPNDSTIQWRVTISSNGFQTLVYDRWGLGNPLSNIVWDGRDFQGKLVPNGTYAIRLEVPGLTVDNSLSVTVSAAQITGNVTLGGSALARAFVNAQRTSGAGYSYTETDANGDYVLNGLQSGSAYNLYVNYQSSTTQAQISSSLQNVTAPATGRNFALALPGLVRVSVTVASSAPVMNYGSLNIFTTNYTQNYWGNLRILPGMFSSDNGDNFNPSSWTVMGVPPGSYKMRLQIPGFDTYEQTLTVVAGQTQDIPLVLSVRASIFGKITLPTTSYTPTWVSVQATPLNSTFPTAFGGAYFDTGISTSVFSIFAVSPGTYSFVVQAQGFAPLKSTGVIVGSTNIGNPTTGGLDFSGFNTGSKIMGTITVNGDTSNMSGLNLWINAFSQQLGQNAFTQVQLATNTTTTSGSYTIGGLAAGTYQVFPPYISGFEASPAGPQTVTVVSGTGTLNVVINENTGAISGSINLGGPSDYNNIHLSLSGPVNREIDLSSGPGYSITGLNTGYYRVTATYRTSGAQVQLPIAVVNGQTSSLAINLSAATYGVSGTVSVQNSFTMQNSSGAVVTITTLTELLATATSQIVTLGGTALYTGPNTVSCSGGTQVEIPTARVEAFPKNFSSYDQANRNGLTNCFGVGSYKYGAVAANGSYSISGLTPGLWEVSVYPYPDGTASPSVAITKRIISVTGSTVTGVDFGLSDGNSISGTVSMPTGVSDNRDFTLEVVTDRGDTVQSVSLSVGSPGNPAASASFSIPSLAAGKYALLLRDQRSYDSTLSRFVTKYVAKPVQIEITGSDLSGIDVALSNAGRIVGSLAVQGANPDGTPSQTLVTSSNLTLLPDNFRIYAKANPWVPSGYAEASRQSSGSRVDIDANNQFSIDGLIAGTYDVSFRQDTFGTSVQGQGSLNIAAATKGAVILSQGQTLDLGTIVLKPGLPISGLITDTSGTPLPNIRVRANPSNSQHGEDGQETFTNGSGRFTFSGLNPDIRIYDFVAAPRPYPGDNVQPVPYGQKKRIAVDISVSPAPTINFTLPTAQASLTGTVTTVDNGALSYPGGDNEGYPAAAVYVKLQGDASVDNPLGDENATGLDGSFNITNLPAGTYDIIVQCLGYRPQRITNVTLTNTARSLGTITLQTGPSLTVTLTKPDGSAVNVSDVDSAVAASADLNSIIFGQINSDAQTGNISSIKFAGFELSPKSYSVLLFDPRNNILVPPDGRNISFTSSSDALTRALTFQPSAPVAIANVQKSGSDVLVSFYFSRPVRNGPGDQDPTTFLTLTNGAGSLSSIALNGDRRQLTATYTPAAGESNATIAFSASSIDINPATGIEFVMSKTITLLLGQKATAEQSINPALGGEVSLADSLDPSNVSIQANSLLNEDGTAADPTASYSFTMSATDDAEEVGAGSLAGAPRVSRMMRRGPGAYLSEAYAAMQSARAQADVNPLSSFYSVLLPAGLSHTLHQTATLTLNYDTSADPNLINVYFFNGSQYLLEQNTRVVDTVNHTISVNVNHFSTFVVLQSNQAVITVNGDVSSNADITVFNFPNPFNLDSKTKTLNHGGTTSTITTEGTVIRYTVPAAKVAPAKIDIYNIVGEKVRSLDLGTPTADTFQYIEWNGRNDAGKKVASGVYIGLLKVGSEIKSFKMAVIK